MNSSELRKTLIERKGSGCTKVYLSCRISTIVIYYYYYYSSYHCYYH